MVNSRSKNEFAKKSCQIKLILFSEGNHENSVNIVYYATKHLMVDQSGILHLSHVKETKATFSSRVSSSQLHDKKKKKKDPSFPTDSSRNIPKEDSD